MKDDIAEYVKALELKPGTILLVDFNKADVRVLSNIRLAIDFPVPILAVDGTPSIELLTREQLTEALRRLEESNSLPFPPPPKRRDPYKPPRISD